MSAVKELSGLVLLTMSFVGRDPKPTMRLSTPSRRVNLWADAMAAAISGNTADSLSDLNGVHFVGVQVAGNKL
jgi:hypothetical protein